MRRAPRRLLSVSLLVLIAVAGTQACAPALSLTRDTEALQLADLRAEYLSMNPDSRYREEVTRGQIVKGMDAFGVLASWGSPERKARTPNAAESWVYVDSDRDSGDSIEYSLSFREGILTAWETRRRTAGGPAMRGSETAVVTTPEMVPLTGKKVPQE